MKNRDIKIVADYYLNYLKQYCSDVVVAGSIRREVDTPGDIDFLVIPNKKWLPNLRVLHDEWLWGGDKKIGIMYAGIHIDIMITNKHSWGAALLHFTGSQVFNIKMRSLAKSKGWKLNESGLFQDSKVVSKTEEQIFSALGLKYIPPRMRTDSVRLSEWAVSHSQKNNRKILENY